MKFIDVHCHLDGRHFENLNELFNNMSACGVEKAITCGVDLTTSAAVKEIAERYAGCYFTAGFHPTELKEYRETGLDKIAVLAAHSKCVAIGEIGLDYHYPDTDKPLQKDVFIKQLQLAYDLGLPVQIHSRNSAEDMYEILKANSSLLKHGFLLHCYSHSAELAAELEKMGAYFSFGGTSTYSGSKKARRAIASLGLDRLLTETDSPYMPPVSRMGQFPNTPESIPEISSNFAALHGVTEAECAERMWQNAHRLFEKLN
ncbi:MAG: TatD family hydrolase [Clostridia bacterium]|nr:TatD family hydrolase [Clostridia bacterium]